MDPRVQRGVELAEALHHHSRALGDHLDAEVRGAGRHREVAQRRVVRARAGGHRIAPEATVATERDRRRRGECGGLGPRAATPRGARQERARRRRRAHDRRDRKSPPGGVGRNAATSIHQSLLSKKRRRRVESFWRFSSRRPSLFVELRTVKSSSFPQHSHDNPSFDSPDVPSYRVERANNTRFHGEAEAPRAQSDPRRCRGHDRTRGHSPRRQACWSVSRP